MIEVVALGVAGVLEPAAALWRAEMLAARDWLRRQGRPADAFLRGVRAARRAGRSAPIAVAASHRALGLSAADRISLLEAVRRAVPRRSHCASRALLLELRRDHRLLVVEEGPALRLHSWLRGLGVADLPERTLCTEDLGREARPPRPLAFRWLADRVGAAPARCLYVAGRANLGRAARQAGWQVVDATSHGVADLEGVLARLSSVGAER